MNDVVEAPETPAPGADAVSPAATPPADPAAKPGDPAGEQAKPPAEPAKPETPKYTGLKVPEGYEADPATLGQATEVFQKLGLSQEQAQALLEFDAQRNAAANTPEAKQKALDAAIDTHNKQVDEWESSLKADKEFGGAKFEENVTVAMKAIEAYGSPELSEMLKESGLGSHPLFVKFAHKIGQELGEGKLHRSGNEVPQQKSLAERMYPNYNS